MPLISIGLGEGAPAAVLEQAAVSAHELGEAATVLAASPAIDEAVVVSTCARTEAYVRAADDQARAAVAAVEGWFASRVGDAATRIRTDAAAARHLFEVAAGLRSPVLGDRDVVGQVRRAWQNAEAAGAAGSGLALLFRHAIEASRRVHRQTGLGAPTDSIPAAVADLIDLRMTPLSGRRVLVVGAGGMGAGIAAELHQRGAAQVVVANRSPGRAQHVAARVGGVGIGLERVGDVLVDVDAACVAVGPERPVIDRRAAVDAMGSRPTRPLLLVDVGVPRGVAADVAGVPGVCRLGLNDVRRFTARARVERAGVVEQAHRILAEEVAEYEQASRCRYAAPVLSALYEWGEDVRAAEVARAATRGFSPEQLAAVDAMSRRLVNKLLRPTTTALREAAGTSHGDWLAAWTGRMFSERTARL